MQPVVAIPYRTLSKGGDEVGFQKEILKIAIPSPCVVMNKSGARSLKLSTLHWPSGVFVALEELENGLWVFEV